MAAEQRKTFLHPLEHRKFSYFLHLSCDNELISMKFLLLWDSAFQKGSKIFLWYIFLFVRLRIFFSDKYCQELFLTWQVLVHVQLHLIQKSNTIKTKMLQDESPNVTRYLVLAKTANLPKEHGQYKVFFFLLC